MGKIADAMEALMSSGLEGETLLNAVRAFEDKSNEKTKAGRSERNRRYYEKRIKTIKTTKSVLKNDHNSDDQDDLRRLKTTEKNNQDTPHTLDTPPKGGVVGVSSGEVSEAFEKVWVDWRSKLKLAGQPNRGEGKSKTLEVWKSKAKKFGLDAVLASCVDALAKTEPKYLPGLIVHLRSEKAENFTQAKPESVSCIAQERAKRPEWQRRGYRSEQHWIDCQRGLIAPDATGTFEVNEVSDLEKLAI